MIYTYCITLSLPHSLPISPSGCPSFTIRKPSTVTLPIDQLARAGLFDTTRASARGLTETDTALVALRDAGRSEEHTSELQSLMRISYAVFCLKKTITKKKHKQ